MMIIEMEYSATLCSGSKFLWTVDDNIQILYERDRSSLNGGRALARISQMGQHWFQSSV